MILTDDNFASIVSAVRYGRGIYANIRKSVAYLLGCNIAEIGILLIAAMLGLPSPLNAIQLLWLNLVTDGAPALALGTEPAEPGLMSQMPRHRDEPILNWPMRRLLAIQSLVLTAVVILNYGLAISWWPEHAATLAFATLALAELPLAYANRSETLSVRRMGMWTNRNLQIAIFVSLIAVLAAIYIPALNGVFHTVPLNAVHWALVVPTTLIPALAVEALKPRRARGLHAAA
jgi:Ca2+-transporting ATPase